MVISDAKHLSTLVLTISTMLSTPQKPGFLIPHHGLYNKPYCESQIPTFSHDICSSFSPPGMAGTRKVQPDFKVNDLDVFANAPVEYEPSVDWLDGLKPAHPCFDDSARIEKITTEIKNDLLEYALEACHHLLKSPPHDSILQHAFLCTSFSLRPNLWIAALSAQHYGVIYLVSRFEAREKYHSIMVTHPEEVDTIDNFLQTDAAGIRAINYAVHAYITRGRLLVDHAAGFVPPNAISSLGERHVTVRAADFTHSAQSMLAEAAPLWDLHDFAHLSCATLCPPLFGNKYQSHLAPLPKQLTALIRSPGMRTAKGPKISDGMIFSELLTPLFTDEIEGQTKHTYTSLTRKMAQDLADYLLARRGLRHLSTGQVLTLSVPISPTQLAVLVQNKSYELPASELEQRVFTRGGPAGSVHDVLLPMTARERVQFLAESRSWLYFEVRNTTKHRAHKQAYGIVCEELMKRAEGDGEEMRLLEKVKENIAYEDWMKGERLNLWELVI